MGLHFNTTSAEKEEGGATSRTLLDARYGAEPLLRVDLTQDSDATSATRQLNCTAHWPAGSASVVADSHLDVSLFQLFLFHWVTGFKSMSLFIFERFLNDETSLIDG